MEIKYKNKIYKLTKGSKWNCCDCDLYDNKKGCIISIGNVSFEIARKTFYCEDESCNWKENIISNCCGAEIIHSDLCSKCKEHI